MNSNLFQNLELYLIKKTVLRMFSFSLIVLLKNMLENVHSDLMGLKVGQVCYVFGID